MLAANLARLGCVQQPCSNPGQGSVYYIEDGNGEKVLPVFTTLERVNAYCRATFDDPKPYMDMLESVSDSHVKPLTEGSFIVMALDTKSIAEAAVTIGADYLSRDLRPGSKQETIREPKAR